MKKERTPIYDLDNSYFLYQDIEDVLNLISELYDIKFGLKKNDFNSKTILSKEHHWASNKSIETFNKLVPKLKSLTKDMYSIIEGVYKSKTGKFNKPELEKKYKFFKEFRVFNNKLKHHNDREATIKLTEISMIKEKETIIGCYIQFNYIKTEKTELIRFTDLINVFFKILEDENIINIIRE